MDTPDPSPLGTWTRQTGAGVWQLTACQVSDRNIPEGFSASALVNHGALTIARADKANTTAPSPSCRAAPLFSLAALQKVHRQPTRVILWTRPSGHYFAVSTLSCRPTPVGELLPRCSISSMSVCYAGTCFARIGATKKWQAIVRKKREGHICGVAKLAEPSSASVTGLAP
jgi:hypothetical protein